MGLWMSLEGKVVLIRGTSSEIGRATEGELAINGASLVITGEGKIDSQTIYGKAPIGVAKIAKKYNIPVNSGSGNYWR